MQCGASGESKSCGSPVDFCGPVIWEDIVFRRSSSLHPFLKINLQELLITQKAWLS